MQSETNSIAHVHLVSEIDKNTRTGCNAETINWLEVEAYDISARSTKFSVLI